MNKITTDIEMSVTFPKCNEILRKRSKASFLKDLEDMKKRMEYFKYIDSKDPRFSNDVRKGYEQFVDDADTFLSYFEEIVIDICEAMDYYNSMVEHAKACAKVSRQYIARSAACERELTAKGLDPLSPYDSVKEIEKAVDKKSDELMRRKAKLDKVEEEIAITADKLAAKKSEMEKALRHRYTLTESQKKTLLEEKDRILDGVEKWGSVYGALSHDRNITSKQSTIQLYMQLFPEFGEAIKVSKAMFKDRLDGIMVERALEGTENPVFSKGEHVGDYKVKDNKLFLELMKAKVPEEYNKKAVETVKNQQINNMNIISFANVDETEKGYTKNVGMVIDVDDTGRVERVTQEKKMIDFYSKKPGAEIIAPEETTDDSSKD